DTLRVSTRALASGSAADDSTYTRLEGRIASLTSDRDALAGTIKSALTGAAFNGRELDEHQAQSLIRKANDLLASAAAEAAAAGPGSAGRPSRCAIPTSRSSWAFVSRDRKPIGSTRSSSCCSTLMEERWRERRAVSSRTGRPTRATRR